METVVFLRVKIFPKYGYWKIIQQIAFLFANFKATSISSEMGLKKISENLDVKLVYVLLDGVGDLPHPDLAGKTPLEAANTTIHPKIADLLRKHGAKTAEELKAESN